ncbi:MAG: 4-alpha-glucanotransferase [Spirochaetaceae bacterium]|nr:4-alpha-glucanotransferase [Spirochaetaceae bacterium]
MKSSNENEWISMIPSKSFIGIKSSGIFAPLAYWRSDSDWGIGDLDTLSQVIVFARKTNQSIIQLLPLNLPSNDNSPYSIASSYILDPVYIGIQHLLHFLGISDKEDETIKVIIDNKKDEIAGLRNQKKSNNDLSRTLKYDIFRNVYEIFQSSHKTLHISLASRFKSYCDNNSDWLSDHLLYFILSKEYHSDNFREWPEDIAKRNEKKIKSLKEQYKDKIQFEAFLQWIMTEELLAIQKEAGDGEKSVEIMFDQPFAFGNADVWTNRKAFYLDADSLKRDYTQGAPPHRLDIPQHWQFTLLNFEQIQAKELLLKRFKFLLQFCSLLRIDHLLGYYQVYFMSEDVKCDYTLKKLGLWDEIEGIFSSSIDAISKREQIFTTIVSGLKKHLPKEIYNKVFDEKDVLRHGNALLAARRGSKAGKLENDESGWYKVFSEEFSQNVFYSLLNPQKKVENDYLIKIIEQSENFLQPDDNLQICFFNWGLGEELLSDFMYEAQAQGKTIILENLGLVPPLVEDSVKAMGACEFKPLYFGYQFFIGNPNSYWFDHISERDYATFSIHDTVPLESWWTGRGEWSNKKYYFKDLDQKKDVINWLVQREYLSNKNEADIDELTPQMHKAILSSVADSHANMAVLMMPDIFKSGEEGIINIPGQSGWWTTRAPVSVEDLISETGKKAKEAVSLLLYLASLKNRDHVKNQLAVSGSKPVRIINTLPSTKTGTKQIRFLDEKFIVHVSVSGKCKKVELIFNSEKSFELYEIRLTNMEFRKIRLFRIDLQVTKDFIGCNPFRISIDGEIKTSFAYLIGLEANMETNPLAENYGIVNLDYHALDFSENLFYELLSGPLKNWLRSQRWFLTKPEEIDRISIFDFFELKMDSADSRCFGIICNIKTRSRLISYFIPLLFMRDSSDSGHVQERILSVIIKKIKYHILPAEHRTIYQEEFRKMLFEESVLISYKKNRVKNTFVDPHLTNLLNPPVTSARNLLIGTGDTSSNILTNVEIGTNSFVVKTVKTGDYDIEMEMYEVLSKSGYKSMPRAYSTAYLETENNHKIPLSITIEKITGPETVIDENWKMKAGYNVAKVFTNAVERYKEIPGNRENGNNNELCEIVLNELIRKDLDPDNQLTLKTLNTLSYRKLINDIGEVIAGFNIRLGKNNDKGFGKAYFDNEEMKRVLSTKYIRQIESRLPSLDDGINDLFRSTFINLKDKILEKIDMLCSYKSNLFATRIHGDMQLDQILLDENFHLKIIDFGGAPGLKIDEKRAKSLAVVDIAGIISAFGYIKFYVLNTYNKIDRERIFNILIDEKQYKERDKKLFDLIDFSNTFEQKIRSIIIDSYTSWLERNDGISIIIEDWDLKHVKEIIDFAVISRGLYEITYEISVRPSEGNALIPLASIARLL